MAEIAIPEKDPRIADRLATLSEIFAIELLPGYLRRNGRPYSDSTEITEYHNTHSAYGQEGFTMTTIMHDPVYLAGDFVTSTTFPRLDDRSEWNATRCNEPE